MSTAQKDPNMRSPQELKEMTLDELLNSLPLTPWDKDDPDPLVQKLIRQSSTTAPTSARDGRDRATRSV